MTVGSVIRNVYFSKTNVYVSTRYVIHVRVFSQVNAPVFLTLTSEAKIMVDSRRAKRCPGHVRGPALRVGRNAKGEHIGTAGKRVNVSRE